MPNWVEGKLKVRGKPEDIGKWATECLHCYITRWIGNEPQTEIAEKAIRFEHEPSGDEMYLNVDRTAYIEGTERNFIEEGFYNNLCKEDGKSTLVVRMKAAWGIEVGPYIEMSKSTIWTSECTDMSAGWSSTKKSKSSKARQQSIEKLSLKTTAGNARTRCWAADERRKP